MRKIIILLLFSFIPFINEGKPLSIKQFFSSQPDLSVYQSMMKISNENSFLNTEFIIDFPSSIPAPKTQKSPIIEFDGENYLAIWTDYIEGNNTPQIFGVRITKEGKIIDEKPFYIGKGTATSMIFDGTNYFLVFHQYNSWNENDIYGIKIAPDGSSVDSGKIKISGGSRDESYPSISFNGDDYFVVWQDSRNLEFDSDNPSDIYGARINKAGEVIDKEGIEICSYSMRQGFPYVKFNGEQYLVVWEDNRNDPSITSGPSIKNIFGIRLSKDGQKLDSQEFIISEYYGYQNAPAIINSNQEFIVLWADSRNSVRNIYGTKVTSDGNVLNAEGIQISNTNFVNNDFETVSTANQTLIIWQESVDDEADIYGLLLNDGVVAKTESFKINNAAKAQLHPVGASDGQDFIILWSDYRYSNTDEEDDTKKEYGDIFGTGINKEGEILDENGFVVSIKINNKFFPSIAFDGENYFAVWMDDKNIYSKSLENIFDIYGARISNTGELLDVSEIEICTADSNQYDPSVAFDGENYLVVWTDVGSNIGIYGNRVSKEGKVLDGQGFPISETEGGFSQVIFDGEKFLVIWVEIPLFQKLSIKGAFIDKKGSIIQRMVITDEIDKKTANLLPKIAFDGNNYFIVWENDGIYGTMFSKDGSNVFKNKCLKYLDSYIAYPDVSFDGSKYFIVWSQNNNQSRDIFGFFMETDGTIVDEKNPICISSSDGFQDKPSVSFDGSNYFVVWEDLRNDVDLNDKVYVSDIYGVKVSTKGFILGEEMAITDSEYKNISPALRSPGNGDVLIIYVKNEMKDHDSNRLLGRIFKNNHGAECVLNSECSTSLCIDGVCCVTNSCESENTCVIGSCAGSGDGTCTYKPGREGQNCDDNNPDTFDDVCIDGECKGRDINDSENDSNIDNDNDYAIPDETEDKDKDKDKGCSVLLIY